MTSDEAYQLQKRILEGSCTDDEILSILYEFDRPLNADEFYGLYQASREALVPVPTQISAVDTCGTGGDGLNTFNISTTAAILAAALGVPVAKHGNRSASGNCGSADVLEALGVPLELSPVQAADMLAATNFCFLFAPRFNPGFRHAATARKKFGKRTYFNFLGPLLNPASAPFRLVGVSDATMVPTIGSTLVRSGVSKAWVVQGADGMDEISPTGPTYVSEFVPQQPVREFTIDPREYGLEYVSLSALVGSTSAENADILKVILQNEGTPAQTEAVILNVAAVLAITGGVSDYAAGIAHAQKGIAARRGADKLQELKDFSKKEGFGMLEG